MLQALGYQTILARNGLEALQLFETNKTHVDLLLLDVVMPRLSGPEVYARILSSQPGVKVIFTTGYTAEGGPLAALVQNGATILQKPYSLSALSQAVRKILDEGKLQQSSPPADRLR